MECDLFNGDDELIADDFNSRTHVECDRFNGDDELIADDFNSRTHVECDKRTAITFII